MPYISQESEFQFPGSLGVERKLEGLFIRLRFLNRTINYVLLPVVFGFALQKRLRGCSIAVGEGSTIFG